MDDSIGYSRLGILLSRVTYGVEEGKGRPAAVAGRYFISWAKK